MKCMFLKVHKKIARSGIECGIAAFNVWVDFRYHACLVLWLQCAGVETIVRTHSVAPWNTSLHLNYVHMYSHSMYPIGIISSSKR